MLGWSDDPILQGYSQHYQYPGAVIRCCHRTEEPIESKWLYSFEEDGEMTPVYSEAGATPLTAFLRLFCLLIESQGGAYVGYLQRHVSSRQDPILMKAMSEHLL